jgi:hypothetical protein
MMVRIVGQSAGLIDTGCCSPCVFDLARPFCRLWARRNAHVSPDVGLPERDEVEHGDSKSSSEFVVEREIEFVEQNRHLEPARF